jgi:cellulose synthase/poly-beta-1,6-N-acetylglucosamine synthase-like glycosyltransferase
MIASAFLISIVLIVFGIHLLYPLLLKRIIHKQTNLLQTKNRTNTYSHFDLPMVTILIPVYSEESVIVRRINNIFDSTYPRNKLEVIVVDSGSPDKTRSEINSNFQNTVTLITEEERKGKAHAINLGLEICKGDIVILTDGTALYDRDTIFELVKSFKDTSIGGVSALYHVPNSEDSLISASEHRFWLHKDEIRVLESSTHSTSWLSGEACAFRKNIVTNVDEDTLADDSNIALQIISKGYRSVVNQNAYFTERSPTQFSDYVKVKSRRTLGGLIETLRFKSLFFNSKYEYFGMIIFPYRFFTYLVSPILSCVLIGVALLSILEVINNVGLNLFLVSVGLAIVAGFILRNTILTYFYTQLFTIIALLWLLRGNIDVRWNKSKSR